MIFGLMVVGILVMGLHFSASSFSCQFGRGQWRKEDWIMVKCARWDHFQDHWLQNDDCIQNPVPDRPMQDWITHRGDETYTSMVYGRKFSGAVTVRATVEFDPQLCPVIVFSGDLVPGKGGRPEYRHYTEVVFFDQGLNVWTHTCREGKEIPDFELVGFGRFPLRPKTRYSVEVNKIGKTLAVKVDGHYFGVLEHRLPEEVYIGITGCEGNDRFYDFSVSPLKKEGADPFLFYAYDVPFNP